jgi:hypothetical protein
MGAMSRTSGFKPPLRVMAFSKRHSVTIDIAGEIARAKIRRGSAGAVSGI